MKSMKLSPLLMFAMLLIILVISVIIGRWNTSEGFVAFQQDKPTGSDGMVWIPQYSGDVNKEGVYKLNDNMFFDFNNGNLIELDADEYKIVTGTTATEPPATDSFTTYEGMENEDVTGPANLSLQNAQNSLSSANEDIPAAQLAADNASETNGSNNSDIINAITIQIGLIDIEKGNVENTMSTLNEAINAYVDATTDTEDKLKQTIETATSAVEEATNKLNALLIDLPPLLLPLGDATDDNGATETGDPLNVPGSGSANQVTSPTSDTYNSGVDTTGISINRIIITPRNGSSSKIYKTSTKATVEREESKLKSIISSYSTWTYTSQCKNTTPKFVIYMCWERTTYIIIIDQDNTSQPYSVFTFNKDDSGITETLYEEKDIRSIASSDIVGSTANTIVNEPLYADKKIFMVSSKIGYDIQRGNVFVKPDNADARVNDRNGNPYVMQNLNLTNEDTLTAGDKMDWRIILNDSLAGFVILDGEKTIISTFSNNMGKLELKNVKRFTPSGIYINGELHPNELTKSFEEKEEKDTEKHEDSDYILKTQIVPPVCPTCPTCPDKVACTNCGGNGGSGTLKSDGKSILSDVVSGTTDVASGIVSGTTGIARDAVSGTTGIARDAVSGSVGLAKDTVSGSVGLAKDAVSGSVGLARDAVSGTAGLLRDTASGVSGLFRTNPTRLNQMNQQGGAIQMNQQGSAIQMNQQGNNMQYPQTATSSTYFGALPDRTSNYMPITADFSAFSS